MRIISGKYKGKKIEGFNIDGTRPTMDRVKESLFAMIQNNIKDSICLDLFAGSGSLGLEALSNGASKCYFCDNNNIAIKAIKKTLDEIKEVNAVLKLGDYEQILKSFKNEKFNIIFLDPPYKMNLINNVLNIINELDLLNDNGISVCEYETEIVENNNFEIIKERKYGTINIKIYKKLEKI